MSDRQRHSSRRRRLADGWASFLYVNGLCTAIWAASGAGYFWPIWVMIPTGAVCVANRLRGSAPEAYPREGDVAVGASPPQQRTPDESTAGPATQRRRVVMSVLFVDVVGSTQHAAALGDDAWHAVFGDYEQAATESVRLCDGEVLFTKGDEIVAGFALPAAAVACAQEIRARAHALGLEVRVGVHAGEVDRMDRQVNGIAMHIGRRVCESAAPGQVLVSSTVHDLLTGSSVAFSPAGAHELKGLTGSWQLYEPVG